MVRARQLRPARRRSALHERAPGDLHLRVDLGAADLTFALFLALILNEGLRGLWIYRGLLYLPRSWAPTWRLAVHCGARCSVAKGWSTSSSPGLASTDPTEWASQLRIYPLIALHVWTFGSSMVIFLAGLRQIPRSLYDAASVDGAGTLRQFRSVTCRCSRRDLLQPRAQRHLVIPGVHAGVHRQRGTGGPVDSTLLYSLYLYIKGFKELNMGYASAMAWVACWPSSPSRRRSCSGSADGGSCMATSSVLSLHRAVPDMFRPMQRLARHTFLIGLSLVMLYPLLWMLSASFTPQEDIFTAKGLISASPRSRTTSRAGTGSRATASRGSSSTR